MCEDKSQVNLGHVQVKKYANVISCLANHKQKSHPRTEDAYILGLQPRDKAAMLVVNTKEIFLLNLHQNRVHFPAERNAFVLDHQHGRRDVTCKPAINKFFFQISWYKFIKVQNRMLIKNKVVLN